MTECERILSTGKFSKDFLKEEVRDGFKVTTEQKKIWLVILDLLLEFDRVCKKYNLTYFLVRGSLVGAAKYNGFVPWDDDLDVALPRKDYEKLLTLANEFEEPYFLQTPYTDPGFYYSFTKLRNSNTCAINQFYSQGINQGFFIDIFQLDYIDKSDSARKLFSELNELHMLQSTAMRLKNHYKSEDDKRRIANYPGGDPLERYEYIQELCKSAGTEDSSYISTLTSTRYGFDRTVFPKELFSHIVYRDFESISAPVPVGYEELLSIQYGDWKKLPNDIPRHHFHSDIVYDTERSYRDYTLEELEELYVRNLA